MQTKGIKNSEKIPVGRMVESIISCKWSLAVLAMLRQGINRPGAMERSVDGLTTKVLNERLRKMVRFGIAEKTVYPEVPPRVEYNFTEFGLKFLQLIDAIDALEKEISEEPQAVND